MYDDRHPDIGRIDPVGRVHVDEPGRAFEAAIATLPIRLSRDVETVREFRIGRELRHSLDCGVWPEVGKHRTGFEHAHVLSRRRSRTDH